MNILTSITGKGVIQNLNFPLIEYTLRQHITAIGFVSLITIWAISIRIKMYKRKNEKTK